MNYYIIPEPWKTESRNGCFHLDYDTEIVLNVACTEMEWGYAKKLSDTVRQAAGMELPIVKGSGRGRNEICLYLTGDDESMPENVRVLLGMERGDDTWAVPDAETERYWRIRTETYELEISEERVTIRAAYSRGILYGVQTLRQMVSQLAMVLPCVKIEDRPEIANRGFYHDATRGRIQKLDAYKRLADKLSYYKVNQLQLYVEHSYLFRDFSEVWRDDTPLTAEEILELDAYCGTVGVELVPSLATFGHLDKVLKTKSYAHLCELEDSDTERFSFYDRMAHHTINISDPEAWNFIEKLLLEFMPLFRSRQFNLCGDETFDLGKGRSRKLADEVGTHRMYVDFVKKICGCLVANGRRPQFWGDIIAGSPELLKELPESIICLTWGYGEKEEDRNARIMDNVGAVQYLCPGVHGWRHLMNRLPSAYANISRMSGYAKTYHSLGLLNTDWGDYGHVSHPAFSIPGMIYGAAGAWDSDFPEETELNRRIAVVEFGDATGKVTDILSRLSMQEAVAWEHLVQYKEYMTEGSVPPKEKQVEFYGNMHVAEPARKNIQLAEIMGELADVAVHLNENGRRLLPAYFLHARGQMLLNSLAGTIGAKALGLDVEEETAVKKTPYRALKAVEEPGRLAAELERWFYEYKLLWRQTCKESELYRVQDVIFFFADFLREM